MRKLLNFFIHPRQWWKVHRISLWWNGYDEGHRVGYQEGYKVGWSDGGTWSETLERKNGHPTRDYQHTDVGGL